MMIKARMKDILCAPILLQKGKAIGYWTLLAHTCVLIEISYAKISGPSFIRQRSSCHKTIDSMNRIEIAVCLLVKNPPKGH